MDSVLNNDIYNSVKCNLVNIVVLAVKCKININEVKNKKEQTKLHTLFTVKPLRVTRI